jgi:hypothetical protein
MRDPCMCGAADCVACRGPSARYYGACDECRYAAGDEDEGPCEATPGRDGCTMWERAQEARAEAAWERRHEEG